MAKQFRSEIPKKENLHLCIEGVASDTHDFKEVHKDGNMYLYITRKKEKTNEDKEK